MSWRCEHGIHTYRHWRITPAPDPLQMGYDAWWHVIKCKRCGNERKKFRTHYPIIRSYDWGNR